MSIYFVSITHASSKVTVVPILFLHGRQWRKKWIFTKYHFRIPTSKKQPVSDDVLCDIRARHPRALFFLPPISACTIFTVDNLRRQQHHIIPCFW